MTIHDVIGILDEMIDQYRSKFSAFSFHYDSGRIDALEEMRDRIQAFYDDEAVTSEIE